MIPKKNSYRATPRGGVRVRSDIVEVSIVRRAAGGLEFLQLLRSGDPLGNTWHGVMGHMEAGETAVACARRELREETGLHAPGPWVIGLWALEQVHPYFVAAIDAIVLSPRFACEVERDWTPVLNREHRDWRWVNTAGALGAGGHGFMWPGQRAAVREIAESLLAPGSLSERWLRVE